MENDEKQFEVEALDAGVIELQLEPESTPVEQIRIDKVSVGSDVDDRLPDLERSIEISGLQPNESVEVIAHKYMTLEEYERQDEN